MAAVFHAIMSFVRNAPSNEHKAICPQGRRLPVEVSLSWSAIVWSSLSSLSDDDTGLPVVHDRQFHTDDLNW